jgi:hypothetical protein
VFNGERMQCLPRPLIAASAALFASLALAGSAQARVLEVGTAKGDQPPSCPDSPCLAVSRTTGYQTQLGSKGGAYKVRADGRIVAWTVDLGSPNGRQVAFFDQAFGKASAGITILRRGKKKLQRFNVGESPVLQLEPYLGQTVQFPLATSLAVKKGDIVALTVPTWAPVLTQLLSDGSAWLASRPKGGCDNTDTQTAHVKTGPTRYRCKYTARLTYSATLVTNPAPTASASRR